MTFGTSAIADERRELGGVGREHLAEDLEVGDAGRPRRRPDLGAQERKNAWSTCFAVSTRKPSSW